jgi:hypothetical protein
MEYRLISASEVAVEVDVVVVAEDDFAIVINEVVLDGTKVFICVRK